MSVEVLYNLKYSEGSIIEIKFIDLPESAEKNDKFQWYLIYNNKRYELNFCKMVDNVRYFTCNCCNYIVLDIDKKTLLMGYDDSHEVFDLN